MRIKIGYLNYDIIEVPHIELNGTISNGQTDNDKLLIQLREDMSKEKKRQVLIHELLHAIADNYNVGLEEDEIEALSIGIITTIIDNIKYIKKAINDIELDKSKSK